MSGNKRCKARNTIIEAIGKDGRTRALRGRLGERERGREDFTFENRGNNLLMRDLPERDARDMPHSERKSRIELRYEEIAAGPRLTGSTPARCRRPLTGTRGSGRSFWAWVEDANTAKFSAFQRIYYMI